MQFKQFLLRAANFLFSLVVSLLLVAFGAYSAFALWDNQRIYFAAGDVRADMIKRKPALIPSGEEEGPDFSELLTVNSDVCGWLTLEGTEIDDPIVQGQTNYTYINTDVYGNFALAGSIFLDSRNSRDFSDPYSLIYGHHMADRKMFGDLDLYKDADFFAKHRTGTLIVPGGVYDLEIFSCMLVAASEDAIFDPTRWLDDHIGLLLSFAEQKSIHTHRELLDGLKSGEKPVQILCLSTCSPEFTDARTIILARMAPHSPEK